MPVSSVMSAQPAGPWPWRRCHVPLWRRHGLLAPGIWLMRRLSLSHKALLALLAVTLPLLPLHVREAEALHAARGKLQGEVTGLVLLDLTERLIQATQLGQHASADVGDIHGLVRQLQDEGVHASQQVSGLLAAVTTLSLSHDAAAHAEALRAQSALANQVIDHADFTWGPSAARPKMGLYYQLHQTLLQSGPTSHADRLSLLSRLQAQVQAQQAQVAERLSHLYLMLALSALLGSYLIFSAYRVLKGGLERVTACVQRIRQGDLSAFDQALGRDELGRIIDDLGLASQKLSDLLASAGLGVQAVSHAAQQVALGNSDLAQRNRASTDKVASAVEGVLHYTQQLEACRSEVQQVVNAVDALMRESARSRHQMSKLVDTMRTLSGRSNEIGDIVTLIDGIAFRTNVLALNASVEANKAGELGRGFAVVAQEVRSLALKAAQSAQRIGGVVHASTEDIGLSTALAQQAETQFGHMDAYVGRIKEASATVANMTREGEAESENILEELRHIKGGMDQNLQLVEQLHAASEALSMQSERLQIKLAQFKLQ
jgi:methyl-accepting chemotaxis protein